MPIRNPFARRPGPAAVQDEGSAAGSTTTTITTTDAAHPGFERVDTVGSKASSAFSIRSSRKSQDTGEYKMSVVNDSGVYLPPSPIEREASWPRRYLARTSSDKGSSLAVSGGGGSGRPSGEIEHFSISRESFDSYRRSFDISAKSPVVITTTTTDSLLTRQSLDSSLRPPSSSSSSPFAPRFPRSSLSDQQRRWREPPTPEESETGDGEGDAQEGQEGRFEDVGLNESEESKQQQGQVPAQVKKRGFFAKFGSDGSSSNGGGVGNGNGNGTGTVEESGSGAGTTAMARFLPPGLGGRKRAQSGGQGAELGVMPVGGGVQARGVEV
ncbi:hypothetical protein C8A01DRAFT_46797 [Parachaetomium inaequale]|uniref:Uncharacterized protein n=1 Tax=Parachaetomium inaequale TaxID=2588326 RepID=A0AAN6SQW6_9PEZI|nr:hypothetical protein C8A01DRAFT_46797 [Parachaetomium inaequale]